MMMKLVISLVACCLLIGCGEKEEVKTPPNTVSSTPSPGKITVTAPSKQDQHVKTMDKFRTFDIRGESIIQFAPEGAEITPEVRNVQVNVAVRNTPYASIHARILSQRLSKEFIVFCSACHDDYGNGVIGPSIIDKTEEEILKIIKEYSSQADANVWMTTLVEQMSKDEVAFIAKDIARFNKEIHAKEPKASSPNIEKSKKENP